MKYITVIVLHVLDLPLHLHLFKQSICSIHTGDTISRVKHLSPCGQCGNVVNATGYVR